MSYGMAAALQSAVFQRLEGDPVLTGIVGDAIYDAVPTGPLPATYVTLGDEDVRERSDVTGTGSQHDLTISVTTDMAGFHRAKQAAGAVSDALLAADLTLSRGHVVGLWFVRAQARRVGTGSQRRINLRFRARLEDN